jgi:hypothetical protein
VPRNAFMGKADYGLRLDPFGSLAGRPRASLGGRSQFGLYCNDQRGVVQNPLPQPLLSRSVGLRAWRYGNVLGKGNGVGSRKDGRGRFGRRLVLGMISNSVGQRNLKQIIEIAFEGI